MKVLTAGCIPTGPGAGKLSATWDYQGLGARVPVTCFGFFGAAGWKS